MLEAIWPNLPATFRDELNLQSVKQARTSTEESDAFAQTVADIIKARAQSVKSQWRLSDIFGTRRAVTMDPRRCAPFFGVTYMTVRKTELAALYTALKVKHEELNVDESSAVTHPPTQAQFAQVLTSGLDGVSADSLRCMIAIIADTGIDAWQTPANDALTEHLAVKR